jgi:AcrR family transcriptional regulator
METTDALRTGLRAATRDAIRAQVAERAVVYLDEHGFDETTVEQLAAAVGISPRSFFRYFPTKEDVVVGSLMPLGRLVEERLRGRPEGEQPWVALRASLSPMVESAESDPAAVLRQARVAFSTPGLRAQTLERHATWATFLAPIVADRLRDRSGNTVVAAGALTQCALACLYVATVAWVDAGGDERFSVLLDAAFQSIRMDSVAGE